MTDEPTITVLYNSVHGGWGLSEEVCRLYAERTGKKFTKYLEPSRHDPVLVQLFYECKETGKPFDNAKSCRIESAIILAKYKHFYVIDEYDGLESVRIDHRHYILHHVNLILQDTVLSNDDKIQRINQLGLKLYLRKPEEYDSD
jgi:hypothetical protein